MTDHSTDKPTAEQLSGEHIGQFVRVAPGIEDRLAVSGRLVLVNHSKGNLVRIGVQIDEKNTVELFLRSGVPIAFFHAAD